MAVAAMKLNMYLICTLELCTDEDGWNNCLNPNGLVIILADIVSSSFC